MLLEIPHNQNNCLTDEAQTKSSSEVRKVLKDRDKRDTQDTQEENSDDNGNPLHIDNASAYDDNIYEMERILAHWIRNGKQQFLVR